MKILMLPAILALLSMITFSPMKEVENVKISIPTPQHDIFVDYANDNFSQKLTYNDSKKTVTAELQSSNFLKLNLNFRIAPDEQFMATLEPDARLVIRDLLYDCGTLEEYMNNISFFLKSSISYSEEQIPQDALSVIRNKKANCIGFSNLVKLLLDVVGINNLPVRGFYLKNADIPKQQENPYTLIPVPHRWVEIYLTNGAKFFYDPQHQSFSANYITTKNDVDFKRIRRFKVKVIQKSKKIVN
jgi:transglutaminase-like putative cysteine protease